MIMHVINPAISNGSLNIFIEELDEGVVEKHVGILKLLTSSEYQVCATFQSYIKSYCFSLRRFNLSAHVKRKWLHEMKRY